MNITQVESKGLLREIAVEILPEDYQGAVKKQLKKYQKQANEPGFRPGKVPLGIIQKKYGTHVRLDEVNNALETAINKYIADEKLELIGQPIPTEEKKATGDFTKDDTYVFYFDIATHPEINFDLKEMEQEFLSIKVEDKQINEAIDNVKKQFANEVEVEGEVEENDIVKGHLIELDDDNTPIENGIINENATLLVKYIQDEETKKKFIGAKINDEIIVNPNLTSGGNEYEKSSFLGIEKDKANSVDANFKFTIATIKRREDATIDEELYKKVYPNKEIKTEEEFRTNIAEDIKKGFLKDENILFSRQVSDKILADNPMELPEDFMKRFLLLNDKNLTKEKVDADYEDYVFSIKHQLIENEIIKKYDVKVSEEEIKDNVYKSYLQYFGQQELTEDLKKTLAPLVDKLMNDEEQRKNIYMNLFNDKITAVISENVKKIEKEVSYDEFLEVVKSSNNK